MATTDHLRSRRSAAERHALASVEREIRATDPTVGRKYLRDYRDAYSSYRRVLASSEVCSAVASANIALIGDYHALPGSQRYLSSLVRDCKNRGRSLVVGLETVFSRDQHILNEWFRGEIEEAELRERIRFDLDWGYEWAPFYELLTAARECGVGLYGLDCMPREDLRKIGARDRHAAEKIAEIRARHPEELILVLFGESHLAPQHLPQQLLARLPEERVLTVLQNVDALYWRAAGEAADRVEAVEVRDNVVCVFTATPLEKYENYRLCLDRWGRDGAADLAPTVYNLIDSLIRVLGINQYSPHNTTQPRLLVDLMPEVYTRDSDSLLRRLLSRNRFRGEVRRLLLERVKERGSLYLAPLNVVYIRRFEIASATEDAARFLHQACRGLPNRINGKTAPNPAPEDAFFTSVMEHALAYFGSRVLYPARVPFRDADLLELYELTREDLEKESSLSYSDVTEILDFLCWHRQNGQAQRLRPASPDWTRAFAFTGRKREYLTEQLGSLVGNDLYDAYIDGRLGAGALRRLFVAHLGETGAARELYANLNARLR
jgi:Haem-binding uptake, Tiki superfamily, ChaN